MTDREMLQAAAKAAGMVRMVYRDNVPYVSFSLSGDDFFAWNPLTDDGEALRLAVLLRLLESSPLGDMGVTDPWAATRRAIVRAAAVIGRAK